MATEFTLDPRLAADSVAVIDLPLCAVRLMNDARFPWLILVPRRAGASELIDLTSADQTALLDEIGQASRALKQTFQPHKLNVAALGNVVAQLHVHVIARFHHDAAWPRPVWGTGAAEPYTREASATRTAQLITALAAR